MYFNKSCYIVLTSQLYSFVIQIINYLLEIFKELLSNYASILLPWESYLITLCLVHSSVKYEYSLAYFRTVTKSTGDMKRLCQAGSSRQVITIFMMRKICFFPNQMSNFNTCLLFLIINRRTVGHSGHTTCLYSNPKAEY